MELIVVPGRGNAFRQDTSQLQFHVLASPLLLSLWVHGPHDIGMQPVPRRRAGVVLCVQVLECLDYAGKAGPVEQPIQERPVSGANPADLDNGEVGVNAFQFPVPLRQGELRHVLTMREFGDQLPPPGPNVIRDRNRSLAEGCLQGPCQGLVPGANGSHNGICDEPFQIIRRHLRSGQSVHPFPDRRVIGFELVLAIEAGVSGEAGTILVTRQATQRVGDIQSQVGFGARTGDRVGALANLVVRCIPGPFDCIKEAGQRRGHSPVKLVCRRGKRAR